ncbi:Pyruvate/Phosphoenolpyruvate kinase-like domain-containing protein [Chaetomium tenue]|uniref:Pyruvate/Phosphoenolpyruvate kinase-like domain-containing protein n=1 Tax=Chaetomium tenue TaxID=1854479 RepID=A0ACB7PC82_9PEZI|nr:Pyruvate/Phosphoenolpyruvate kinase-like domain-containing protein [Chaetomium globosum]
MTSSVLPTLRRALFYIPASSPRFLAKSLVLTSDNATYDLEDSVTPSHKPAARTALREHLTNLRKAETSLGEIAVRINGVSTAHAVEDIQAVAALPSLDTIVVPKVNSAADLLLVEDVIRQAAPERAAAAGDGGGEQRPIKLLALIESARAIMDLREICGATGSLRGLIFAAEDFALDASLQRTAGMAEMAYARSAIVTAARAFGLESVIDAVCTQLSGVRPVEQLVAECNLARSFGFNGKQVIHPIQLAVVHRHFTPSPRHVENATRIVMADEIAAAEGRGAFTVDGQMIDAPEIARAHAIISRAKQCGIDIDAAREAVKAQMDQVIE